MARKFGPHSTELMSLNSNNMLDSSGSPLKRFTPFHTVLSSGVNVFSQNLELEKNPCFPTFQIDLCCPVVLCSESVEGLHVYCAGLRTKTCLAAFLLAAC